MLPVPRALDLAIEHLQAGRLHEAEQIYRQILQVSPQQIDALHLLGVIAQQTGRHAEAIAYLGQALALDGSQAEIHYNLGNALREQGKLHEAVASFQQALRLKPDFAEAHYNLGNALQQQGQLEEAVASYQQALRLKPGLAEAYYNLGNALQLERRLEEAVASYLQALRLKPGFAGAHYNLGDALRQRGRLEEAVASYQQGLRLAPDYAEGHNNLGIALMELGRLAEAEASYQQARRLKPDFFEAHNNLGLVRKDQGRLAEALACYRLALRFNPDYAEAHNNVGNALKDQGQLEEALAAYRAALQHKPDAAQFHSNLLLTILYHPGYDAEAFCQECRRWNQLHAEPLAKFILPHTNLPDPQRRLRIGYVSPDFREHVDSFFTVPLLSNHDHQAVEIFCYANVIRPDALTDRLRGYADVWRNTVGLADQQVADMIRSDQIDILVDLTMHMANNRLLVFARKPAPVQVAWLAYPGTTGLPTIDYRLTDPYLDPPGLFDAAYAEESLRLQDTFWCYDPLTDQPLINPLPALESGVITFGCLNNFGKINDGCLALWARALQAVPLSRLLLHAPKDQARERVLAKLQQEGIAPSRVDFADRQSRLDYLRLYHRIDMALDPLPCNGGTTTLDAFWMGVPTLTLVGKTVVGRAGWSQLCNLGLKELAAQTPEQYVTLAAELAADLPRLQELRGTLRQRMLRSPLMDAGRFTRNLEQAYRQMWRRWCQREEETRRRGDK